MLLKCLKFVTQATQHNQEKPVGTYQEVQHNLEGQGLARMNPDRVWNNRDSVELQNSVGT